MKFNVQRTAIYTFGPDSLYAFKATMLDYLEEEMRNDGTLKENEKFPYTIDNISDDIVSESLADAIQEAFNNVGYGYSGFEFDDYFGTVFINGFEDDVTDCVYEAVANWRTKMEV